MINKEKIRYCKWCNKPTCNNSRLCISCEEISLRIEEETIDNVIFVANRFKGKRK